MSADHDPLKRDMIKRGMGDGLDVARAVARWHLGDDYWADLIIDALANPLTAAKKLASEKGE